MFHCLYTWSGFYFSYVSHSLHFMTSTHVGSLTLRALAWHSNTLFWANIFIFFHNISELDTWAHVHVCHRYPGPINIEFYYLMKMTLPSPLGPHFYKCLTMIRNEYICSTFWMCMYPKAQTPQWHITLQEISF